MSRVSASQSDPFSLYPSGPKVLPIAAPATDLKQPPTLTLGRKQSYYKAISAGCLRAAASCAPRSNSQPWTCRPHWEWYSQTQCPMAPPSARSAQGGTRQHTTARGHRGMLPSKKCNLGPAVGQHLPASPAAGTLCVCVSNPSDAGHRMQAVGPEAAHRATLDPNITQPRCARGWIGRARALAREPRSHHRPSSGLLLSKKTGWLYS